MKDQIKHALSDKATKEEVRKILVELINIATLGECFNLYVNGVCCDDDCFICAINQLKEEGVIK